MSLSTASPRKSFSVPVNINLQGARRWQTRPRELLHPVAVQEQEWTRGVDGRGGQRLQTQMPVSSIGEDRAILLGFTMMAFAVLMFFVVGITVVKPYINSNWEEEGGCVLLQTDMQDEWVDCRGVSTVPCLRVKVNVTGSEQTAFLHFDEESVLLTPECFYTPKCQMEKAELQQEVLIVKKNLDSKLGSRVSCFTDREKHPEDAILSRKYTLKMTQSALLWPCLMLGSGALLVGLVKLTQCLACLSAEVCSETTGLKLTTVHAHGKLYKLLRTSSLHSPS
ncbi:calcium-activated potassium channel subunit beta-3 [Thalassophryne amazonica]|uniref:calcium-activated potassium channel subunit beta-3 n=1 Tax=Thalassophryne amazonica TaxID=390379 RepID=UPI00147234CC|nr:calcium-activated potassium channel subunit beta-3 [Thalassophryne amazonica]